MISDYYFRGEYFCQLTEGAGSSVQINIFMREGVTQDPTKRNLVKTTFALLSKIFFLLDWFLSALIRGEEEEEGDHSQQVAPPHPNPESLQVAPLPTFHHSAAAAVIPTNQQTAAYAGGRTWNGTAAAAKEEWRGGGGHSDGGGPALLSVFSGHSARRPNFWLKLTGVVIVLLVMARPA